ncbi:MAG: hypothetical protein IJ229_06930 [Clostridia bacterium]|nr:hypothetical protein [Clostridia bacterium]
MNKRSSASLPVKVILLVLVIVLSLLVLRPVLTDVHTYRPLISSIDERKTTVMDLVAASTAASAVITMIPDDVGTPIAEQLAELSKYFIVVLGALYLEKYLLPLIGFAVTSILLPIACVLLLVSLCRKHSAQVRKLGILLIAVSFVLVLVIPTSVLVSTSIEDTFHESIDDSLSAALQAEHALQSAEEEDKTIWETISEAAQSLIQGVSGAVEWAKTVLNRFVEAITIVLITHCVIPVLVLCFFVWLLKQVTRTFLPRPRAMLMAPNAEAARDA